MANRAGPAHAVGRLCETSDVPEHPVIAIVGATATGKSDLAVEVALSLGAEVVNADAMQLYRGMDVGTAKLPPAQRRGVRHHQLDVLSVRDEASVAAYQRHARADLAAIAERGRRAVLAGGSGLYLRAVLDRLEIPPTDPAVRAGLEADLAELGAPELHRRLAGLDAAAAAAILPSNGRRVVRALEVMTITGRPFTATLPAQDYHRPAVQIGLTCERETLDRRIADRVNRMWADGLVAEVSGLVDAGLREGRTASRALGYAQVLDLIDGRCSDPDARERTVTATRRFARRQESWFRRDARIHWLPSGAPDLLERALETIAEADRAARERPRTAPRTTSQTAPQTAPQAAPQAAPQTGAGRP
jgi:tRNA dimethylallyltransferase